MYLTLSQEVSRLHREEIVHAVTAARLETTARAKSAEMSHPVANLRWELARYAGLICKRLRK